MMPCVPRVRTPVSTYAVARFVIVIDGTIYFSLMGNSENIPTQGRRSCTQFTVKAVPRTAFTALASDRDHSRVARLHDRHLYARSDLCHRTTEFLTGLDATHQWIVCVMHGNRV